MRVTEVPGLRGRGVVHDGGVRQQAAELQVAEPQPVRLAPQHRGLEVPARRQLQELAAEDGVEGVLIVRPEVVVMRSEEHTSELQPLMRNSYAVFCLKKTNTRIERP